jgi:glycosyltransferase involved in cell wall biosynthesis
MSPHKGVHLVVEALNKIGFPIIFVVDGGHSIGDYAEEVKRKGGKKLILTDVLKYTERNELYQKCMFYVTGSQWEGLNLTLLEAQASGKPVIAFDLCAHPEVVGPKSGFLVKDTKEMAAKMKKLIEDKKLRQEMGKEGKKFAKKFDWPIIAKNVEKDIAKVMK